MKSSQKVIVNTGFLYAKMLITIIVSLYATRIILGALGADDYGLFNLVGGVVAMLSFLNTAMASATQRFMSFYLGSGESHRLKQVFQSSIILHLIIGVFVVVLLELFGVIMFNGWLNIPVDRIATAKLIFQFMVVSTFFSINAVPYDAVINANENMLFDSLVGVFEVFSRLIIAICIAYTSYDKLIFFGGMMALLTILIRIIKSIYCYQKYEECKFGFKLNIDKKLLKEMFSFGSWSMVGALCGLARSQGLQIVLNIFYGTFINASYAIAVQVNGQLYNFSANMLKAINPQIVKSEGGGDRQRMLSLSMSASKFSFYLLSFFTLLLLFEMPFFLKLWLKDVPAYTTIFCQLTIIGTLVNQLTIGLQTAVQSTGKIKYYQIVVGGLLLMNLPVAYLLLKFGMPPYSVLISFIIIEGLGAIFRIQFLKMITGLSFKDYVNKVLLKIFIPISITVAISFIPSILLKETVLRVVIIGLVSMTTYLGTIYYFGINKEEHANLKKIVYSIKEKIISKT